MPVTFIDVADRSVGVVAKGLPASFTETGVNATETKSFTGLPRKSVISNFNEAVDMRFLRLSITEFPGAWVISCPVKKPSRSEVKLERELNLAHGVRSRRKSAEGRRRRWIRAVSPA